MDADDFRVNAGAVVSGACAVIPDDLAALAGTSREHPAARLIEVVSVISALRINTACLREVLGKCNPLSGVKRREHAWTSALRIR